MQSSSIEIPESDLENLDRGGFGTVYRIKNHLPPTVLKDIHEKHDDPQGIHAKECQALKDLHHDHIVKYYGIGRFCLKGKNVIRFGILMEYCEKGSLKDWLYEPSLSYEMNTVIWWSQQMMSALKYLHEMQMVHRDIKPANILVTEDFVLKLGDFGSTRLNHHTTSEPSMIGTRRYMSPELWSDTNVAKRMISTRSDVYSLGLVMWEMIERRKIFSNPEIELAYWMNDGSKTLLYFEPLLHGHELKQIIERCTHFDYNSRPYASELLEEILVIGERIGGSAARPRIDNDQTPGLKPLGSLVKSPVRILNQQHGKVLICSWNPKEDLLATGCQDLTARIWDFHNCEDVSNPDSTYENRYVFKHSSWVWALDWHPNGDRIATGERDGVVRVWDTRSGKLHSTLEGHDLRPYIKKLRWNPDGDLLLSANSDGSIIVWEQPIKTRSSKYQEKQKFEFHSEAVLDVDWISEDTFASSSLDKTIKVCRVGSDRPIRTYTGHTNYVRSVRYDSFSKRLASCSSDKSIKIWSLSEDEPVHTLQEHLEEVNTVRWSPQGSILASGSNDYTVHLWDGNQGEEVTVLNGHTGRVISVAFSPNGQFIASGSYDGSGWAGSVFIWDINTRQRVTSWTSNDGQWGILRLAFNRTGEKLAARTHEGVVVMDLRFLKRGHDDTILSLHRMDTST